MGTPVDSSQPEVQPRGQRLRPDPDLLARVLDSGGEDLRKCMQCATCSSVCQVLDGGSPGPRKEMLWAQWGLRDRLMSDPNVWLCHQCGDCNQRCPRGARPADVMAALRRECIIHYSAARGFGQWVNRPTGSWSIVLAALITLFAASVVWQMLGATAAELRWTGARVVFPFWPRLPHGLLGSLFGALVVFDVVVLARGARRFWRTMVAAEGVAAPPGHRLGPSLRLALSRIFYHDDFAACEARPGKRTQHLLVVFGMVALGLTSLWASTARWNPLLDGLVYPFGFWHPWKVMANLGGLSLLLGACSMSWQRWRRPERAGATGSSDAILLVLLSSIAVSGFACEGLHWLRIEPLRHAVYAVHLAAVFVLLVLLPYSKLAHLVYRTVAMTYAEYTGRGGARRFDAGGGAKP